MGIKSVVQAVLHRAGYTLKHVGSSVYNQDHLWTVHNHDFMRDPGFLSAYDRGLKAVGTDHHLHWRVHIALWAEFSASKLDGDFVECGVNKGFMSSAIMHALHWNQLQKTFYLMDTFAGMDERYLTPEERRNNKIAANKSHLETGFYTSNVDAVKRNFAEWKNVEFVVGPIPDTLPLVRAARLAYMHLDMNCAAPEVAALDYFWTRMVPGAFVLMDDYAYHGYEPQHSAMDAWAQSKNVRIVSLPTGQGLLIKPS